MTVLLEDGPGGLENTHIYTPSGGASLTMNLLQSGDSVLLPRIKFEDMPGFRSLPDADNHRAPRTGRQGENVYRSLVRGKSWSVTGKLQAANLASLRALERSLMLALAERNLEGTWASVPLPAWADGEEVEAGHWEAELRVVQYEPDTSFKAGVSALPTAYQLGFLLGVQMSDARWYWSVPTASASDATDVTVTNRGIAPAEPVITVVNPGAALTVQNDTTGKKLVFAFDAPLTGSLAIDFAARTAYLDGATVVDYTSYMTTSTSTWWDADAHGLAPGANVISQVGASSVQVTFQHATY